MLKVIVPSTTRLNLLIKLFFIDGNTGYIRSMEKEFGESSNAIRKEVNRLEKAGLIISWREKRKKIFQANRKHPLYNDVRQLVKTTVGIEQVVDKVINRLDNLEEAYITGNFATGVYSDILELVLVGRQTDNALIDSLVKEVEKTIGRKIIYFSITPEQMEYFFRDRPNLLIWQNDK